jgi:PAS domain S-box-containing protein
MRKKKQLSRGGLLRENQHLQTILLENAIANLPAGVGLYSGEDFIVKIANPAYLKIASGRNVLGKPYKEVWPEAYPRASVLLKKVLETGITFEAVDEIFILKNQKGEPEERYFTWSLIRIKIPEDNEWGILNTVIETTDRKIAEEKLRDSENKFKLIATHTPDNIILQDNKLRYTLVINPKIGLKTHEMLGKTDLELAKEGRLSKNDAISLTEIKKKVLENGKPVKLIVPIQNSKKVIQYFDGSYVPLFNSKKEADGVAGYFRNITKQKNADEELLKQNELNRLITLNAAHGLFMLNEKHQCSYMNPAAEKIIGYTMEEIKKIDKPLHFIIHHSHTDGSSYALKDCPVDLSFTKNITTKGEEYYIRRDGTFYPVAFNANPIITNGKPKGLVVELRDITEEKRNKEALRYHANLLDIVSDAVFSINTEFSIQSWNKGAEEMYGWKEKEVMGKNATKVLKSILTNGLNRNNAVENLKNYGEWRGEVIHHRKNGSPIYVLVSTNTIRNSQGEITGYVSVCRDITSRKMVEKQKDEFLGIASHELKTPITSLKAYTQLLERMFKKNEDMKSAELLEKMDNQLNKVTSLIGDLLDVTRIESGKLKLKEEYYDFNELINEVTEEVQRTSHQHKIIKYLDRSKVLFGDRERIGQVITNLLTNAIKYSPDSAKIILRTNVDSTTLTLSVRDFGIGIPSNVKDKVFERFFRGEGEQENIYPGLGIGLFISKEIITRQGGQIWVESKHKKGSNFYFSLPIYRNELNSENKISSL